MTIFILNKNNKTVLVGSEMKFYENIKELYQTITNRKPNGDINELAFELIDFGYSLEVIEN